MENKTYAVIAVRYDDIEISSFTGLSKEQAIDKIADLECVIDRYERWDRIEVYQDLLEQEVAEIRGLAASKSVLVRQSKLAAQEERNRQEKERYASEQVAYKRAQYEALKKEFDNG